ncbi:MAG TPA: response regulator [Ktedonobacteraceae bacterium]|jgi:two-component system chemotaxis response regulator CheY|nr:response regulator [Ktedonobacteraceae bacterium]
MHIGLLEDDVAIQEMLRLVLEDAKYTVVIYPTADACLNALLPGAGGQEHALVSMDLLIVDLRLSRAVSGIQVIQQIRNDPHLSSLPIILTTAASFADIEDLSDLRVHFLEKPFDVDHLVKMIEGLTTTSSGSF